MMASRTSSGPLFGELQADREMLSQNWLGRQILKMASPTLHTVVTEGVSFAGVRIAAAIAQQIFPPLQVFFGRSVSLGNGVCALLSHHAVNRFSLTSRATSLFNKVADDLAAYQTWRGVFDATANGKPNQEFFSSLKGPFALRKELLTAFHKGTVGVEENPAFKGIWFEKMVSRSRLSSSDRQAFLLEHQRAAFSTKVAREVWAFAVHIDEALRFLEKRESAASLPWDGFKVSKERFIALYSHCVPDYLRGSYNELNNVLNGLADRLEGVSEEKYLLAALYLFKSTINCDIDEKLLAYSICEDKVDFLLEKRPETKEFSLSDVLKAFQEKLPLELFFTYTNLKTWREFEELCTLQGKIKENYDSLEEAGSGIELTGEPKAIVDELQTIVTLKKAVPLIVIDDYDAS